MNICLLADKVPEICLSFISHPLTTADMYKMGMRITGKTGIAKLKVCISYAAFHVIIKLYSLTYFDIYLLTYIIILMTSEAGIPTLRKLPYGVRSRYTDGMEVNARRQKSVYRLCFLLRTGTGMPES